MSPKEQVLQTLLDAARGEITALTEANKLLAAQVAVPVVESIGDDALFLSLLTNWHFAEGDSVAQFFEALVAHLDLRAAKVSARAADAPSEPSELPTLRDLAELLHASTLSNTAVLIHPASARSLFDAMTTPPAETIEDAKFIAEAAKSGIFCTMPQAVDFGRKIESATRALSSRAADALDSQPTDGEVRNG